MTELPGTLLDPLVGLDAPLGVEHQELVAKVFPGAAILDRKVEKVGDAADALLDLLAQDPQTVAVDQLAVALLDDLDRPVRAGVYCGAHAGAAFAAKKGFDLIVVDDAVYLSFQVFGKMPFLHPAVLEACPVAKLQVRKAVNGLVVHGAHKALAGGHCTGTLRAKYGGLGLFHDDCVLLYLVFLAQPSEPALLCPRVARASSAMGRSAEARETAAKQKPEPREAAPAG